MGRPRVEIERSQFEKLCGLQCTLDEIANFFDCSSDTVERWSQREIGMRFADAYKKYAATGKISLRRSQFELSKRSAAMAIFLGKQYLGQKDNPDTGFSSDDPLNQILARWDDAARK